MPSKYQTFDRSRLAVKPLSERQHDLHLDRWLALEDEAPAYEHRDLDEITKRLHCAKEAGSARVMILGAHVIRAVVNRHIIDLMERGYIDHLAMNGAGTIHDYELARIGGSTPTVGVCISAGASGL